MGFLKVPQIHLYKTEEMLYWVDHTFSLLFHQAEVPLGAFSSGPNIKSFLYSQRVPNASPENSNTQTTKNRQSNLPFQSFKVVLYEMISCCSRCIMEGF